MSPKDVYKTDTESIFVHVYHKGIENRIVFNDEQDFEVFTDYLKSYLSSPENRENIKTKFKVRGREFQGTPHLPKNYFNSVELIAYQLSPDHFHLVLREIAKGFVEKLMRSLCTRYAIYYNKKYQHKGTLFDGSYKSEILESQDVLVNLTAYLHYYARDHSSYPEYLGHRNTPWVKTNVMLSVFENNTQSYKAFVEKYEHDIARKNSIAKSIRDNEAHHPAQKVNQVTIKPRSRKPEIVALSTSLLLILSSLGLRNIHISSATQIAPKQQPQVLAEVIPVTSEPTSGLSLHLSPDQAEELTSAGIATSGSELVQTITIINGASNVNIRQQPSTSSISIGKANGGDSFKFVSQNEGWYEVVLPDGSTGFISAEFIGVQGKNNDE